MMINEEELLEWLEEIVNNRPHEWEDCSALYAMRTIIEKIKDLQKRFGNYHDVDEYYKDQK